MAGETPSQTSTEIRERATVTLSPLSLTDVNTLPVVRPVEIPRPVYPTSDVRSLGNPTTTTSTTTTTTTVPASTVKKIAKTSIVGNPLHKYASWTYNISFWWLGLKDYNDITESKDPAAAISMAMSNSYVIAEQGGMYNGYKPGGVDTWRLPSTYGLDYLVGDVEFTTTAGLNGTTKSSNLNTGSLQIIEPYGISLLDCLITASRNANSGVYENYADRVYMLQIDFQGWDDQGKPMPKSENDKLRKRFPIRLTKVKLDMSNKGAVYTINFSSASMQAMDQNIITTPQAFKITAGTVKEFFDDLAKKWNDVLIGQLRQGVQFADTYAFEFDPAIGNSPIISDKKTSLSEMADNKVTLDEKQKTFNIPQGSNIVQILDKVMAQSKYLQTQLTQQNADQTNIMNAFKLTSRVTFVGRTGPSTETLTQHDDAMQRYPKKYVYKVSEFPSFNTNSPRTSQLLEATNYTCKTYNYLYTGLNTDVLELRINFDMTYFTSALGYNSSFAATTPTATTALDEFATNTPSLLLTQGRIFSLTGLSQLRNGTPMRTTITPFNQGATIGLGGIKNPNAQIALDYLNSIYTNLSGGDMLKPTLKIVGDPTLLKQDDWLYVTDPNKISDYNNWNTMSQAEYSDKYGHVRFDAGDIVMRLVINSPLDIDTDITAQGGVYPPPYTQPNMFNGRYRLLTVKSEFKTGKFEQMITMTRINNDGPVASYSDAIQKFQTNAGAAGATNR